MRNTDALVELLHELTPPRGSGVAAACVDCTDLAERLAARGVRVVGPDEAVFDKRGLQLLLQITYPWDTLGKAEQVLAALREAE